jgi:hypothetical protein
MCVLHVGIATCRDRVLPLASVDKILRPAKSVKNFSHMCQSAESSSKN